MTRSQFMYELMLAVSDFPDEEKFQIKNEFDDYFSQKNAEGISENDIIESLPKPSDIANSFISGEPFHPGKIIEKTSVTPKSILIFSLLVPVCILYEILVFVLGTIIIVLLLSACAAFAFAGTACFGGSGLSIGFIFAGIGGILITISLVLFSASFINFMGSGFAWFPIYKKKILNNQFGKVD